MCPPEAVPPLDEEIGGLGTPPVDFIASPYVGAGVFTFAPDASADVVETIGTPTDVITAWNGQEQRIQLRSLMVRRLKYTITLADELQTMDVMTKLFAYVGTVFAVPMWPDAMMIGMAVAIGTAPTFSRLIFEKGFRAGPIMLWSAAWVYELATLSGYHLVNPVAFAWGPRAVLIPMVQMSFAEDPVLKRGSSGIASIELSFVADRNPWNG